MPLPGVSITATPTLAGQKVTTTTDVDGTFSLQVSADGRYVVRTQMAGFAAATQEVVINSGNRDATVNLELILLSRAQQAQTAQGDRLASAMSGRGFQSLAVTQSGSSQEMNGTGNDIVPAGMPVPGIAPDAATESVAVSGNGSNAITGMSTEEMRQRFNDARQQQGFGAGGGGGFGPGGFGGPGGGPGPGAVAIFRRGGFDINRPHGSVYYTIGDSAMDAAPYSLTGQPNAKPAYVQHVFGANLGGPLNIPKIYKGGDKTFFFVNYNGTRGDTPYDQFSTVPTLLERAGNFSQATYADGSNVQIFNPATNSPFVYNGVANVIPPGSINSAANQLLQFIPLPNLPGDFQNFRFLTSVNNSSDSLNIHVNRSLGASTPGPRRMRFGGPRNDLNIGFHYRNSVSTVTNPFPSVGGTTRVRSFDVPVAYTRSFGKLTNILRVDFNRSRTQTQNLYAFAQNIAADAGITGVSQSPFDWGLPNLFFTDFGSLQDTNPQLLRNQTLTFSDNLIWNHGKHTWRWGGDFRRIQLNTETDSNARGSFIFTGLNTSQMLNGPVAGTGFDFADFLLGLPQQTSVQYGENNYHFRGNSWDLYAQDEWKLRSNLTLNLGIRYEYISPFVETDNRIVNLDVNSGFTSAVPVQPGQIGPFTGAFPATLVHPDRSNFAPRVGFAWKPLSKTVVRGGYGINYNTGAYQTIVQQLAFQPPFSVTQTNVQSAVGELTLQNGFPGAPPGAITNNYGVDPNYRLGYVQIRNLDIQQELRPTLILNIDYTGTKGTNLDILEAPNRTASGIRIPGVQPFNWETSQGDSEANAGSVRLRKRLSQGLSVGGTYTFSKSLDNASTIGSGATVASLNGASTLSSGMTVVAQNAFDLAAERGLSSFDQRHKFTGDYLWELPFGHDRRWLTNNSVWRDLLGDWQWSGDWTIASGLPFTPRLLGNFADVNRGTNGTLRPDLVPGESISISDPSIPQWFNTAAFVMPPAGQFGDARRNSIIGPGTMVCDMAFTKVFPLKESRMLEFRAQTANIFNHPQYSVIDTVLNSPTFGRVTAVGAMRTIQLTARFRF